MPVHRPTWYRLRSEETLDGLPCPRCSNGKLKVVNQGLKALEPKYSSDARGGEDWWPGDETKHWSATLRCDENACGEIAHMIGDTEWAESEIDLGGGHIELGGDNALRIQAVFPAPPLVRVSNNVPYSVRQQLQLAFRMYWTDVSACVARLRTTVEAMLDHQKVPKEGRTRKGDFYRLDLKRRIDAFTNAAGHQGQLQGLRNIGNLGTHGTDDVTDEDLFDAIDVLEFVLSGVYDTRTINAKAKKLADKRHVSHQIP